MSGCCQDWRELCWIQPSHQPNHEHGPYTTIYTIFGMSALLIWAIWAQVRKRGFYFFLDFLVLVLDLLYFRNIIANETGIFSQNTIIFIQILMNIDVVGCPINTGLCQVCSAQGLCQIIQNYRLKLTLDDFDTNLLFLLSLAPAAQSAFLY